MFGTPTLSLTVASQDPFPLVVITGELESRAVQRLPELVLRLVRQADPGRADPVQVVLDLAGVTFLDSSGVRALVLAGQTAVGGSARLVLRNLPPLVHRVLTATGDARHFDIRSERGGPGRVEQDGAHGTHPRSDS